MIQLLHYFERTTGEIAADSHSEKIEKLQKRVEQVKMSEEVGIRFMNAFEEKMMERRLFLRLFSAVRYLHLYRF